MPTDFDIFWASVPRKANKGLARRTFAKLKKQGILPSLEILTKSIEKQGAAYRSRPNFAREGWSYFPHPSSWLNNEAWENEVEAPKKVSHSAPVEGKYDAI